MAFAWHSRTANSGSFISNFSQAANFKELKQWGHQCWSFSKDSSMVIAEMKRQMTVMNIASSFASAALILKSEHRSLAATLLFDNIHQGWNDVEHIVTS